MMAQEFMSIYTVCLPDGFPDASRLIQDYFPKINLKEFCDNAEYESSITTGERFNNDRHLGKLNVTWHCSFEIPINSLIHHTSASKGNNCNTSEGNLVVDVLTNPWDFLKAVQNILDNEIILHN
jgi:hypothetical protein